jgi:hypothetical protein
MGDKESVCSHAWFISTVFPIWDFSSSVTIFVHSYRSRWQCILRRISAVGRCWARGFESPWRLGCSCLVFVVCCVGSGLWDGLITRIEGCYRVCVCDLEISAVGRPGPHWGFCGTNRQDQPLSPSQHAASGWRTRPKSRVRTRVCVGDWLQSAWAGRSRRLCDICGNGGWFWNADCRTKEHIVFLTARPQQT